MNSHSRQPAVSAEQRVGATGFPVVGIGASAGGLKALARFFDALPDKADMAFVIVQHLAPTHESSLAELLQTHTAMPVEQVEDLTTVQPRHVYVIPPGRHLTIKGDRLHLAEPDRPRGQRYPIDEFFRSLAEDQGERAVCIIFSGTGSDGSVGLKSIKESGGVIFVQEPGDADHDGMPKSALATGLVDFSAPAAELAKRLIGYHKSADWIQLPDGDGDLPSREAAALQGILAQIRSQTGHDFSRYRRSTILRRLKRRMKVGQVEDMPSYLGLLRGNEREADALLKDFLISVTNFFRDADAFEALQKQVIPRIFEGKGADDQVRVWVPGCATGEEAYSIAMLLCEHADALMSPPTIQVFASDIDEGALAFARRGLYPDVIGADVSSERLESFFLKEENVGYRVKKNVEEIVVFAQHNLLADPPFSKLDLVSCRNLLIYLERDVQKHVFQLLHYALGDDCFLFLGSSETADSVQDLFRPLDKKYRLYQRKAGPARLVLPPTDRASANGEQEEPSERPDRIRSALGEVHREMMLEAYAPPSVIVDENYEVCYLFGEVGHYLRPREGEPTYKLLQLVPREVRVELRQALFQVFRNRQDAQPRRLSMELDERQFVVDLIVKPVEREELKGPLALVIFEPVEEPEESTDRRDPARQGQDADVVEQLEDELRQTTHRLETIIEEYDTSNEELRASNEELRSMNEELRSTTEELEASKEELQSTNEELETVNYELKAKVEELNLANSDLENLMVSTHIGILFLDRGLCLKRYTPAATRLFSIIPADIGRPFAHVSHKTFREDLPGLAERVLETLETVEEEIEGREGGYYLMRLRPYRTVDDQFDGVIATFVDITDRKKAQEEERERSRHQAIVAELRHQALGGSEPNVLMELAVRQVAQVLDVEYCKMLELQPEQDSLLLRAGVGWREGYVGTATVGVDRDSQAGYTLTAGAPVVVDDLAQEKRFSRSPLFTEHGIVSGLSVTVEGAARPYGVLGAYSARRRTFSDQEVRFLETVANVLGMALERHRAEEERDALTDRLRLTLDAANLGSFRLDLVTNHLDSDERCQQLFGVSAGETMEDALERVHVEDRAAVEAEFARTVDPADPNDDLILEQRLSLQDGRVRWLAVRARAYFEGRGAQRRPRQLAGVAADISERKEAEEVLRTSREELAALNEELETRVEARTLQVRSLASSLMLAEQAERRRISEILHDDLQQLLFSIQLKMTFVKEGLEAAGLEKVMKHVTEAEALLQQGVQTTRQLTVDLSPPILKGEGLRDAMHWLKTQMEQLHGLQVDLQAAYPVYIPDEDMRVLLFQVVRELLFNVKKHAETDRAVVELLRADDDDLLLIRVTDKGKGFDAGSVEHEMARSFGLFNLQERLGLFGGRIEIESAPGKGTRVTVHVPVESKRTVPTEGEADQVGKR